MVRRAFRGAFSDEEVEDIYAGAWVGTLRSLADRHDALSDDEIRSYVLTAVANQASKELRRRKRKPTAPLELVGGVPDAAETPEERVAAGERDRITRDLLTSLPPRRRAVMLLRYGWGLEPKQVCGLIGGLSPRAYRKEVTRGVDELTDKLRRLERGQWCSDREPLLKTYAAGLADDDQRRQAQAHLAHCRDCSEFVARLSGHLHDLGTAVVVPTAIDGIDGHVSLVDRAADAADRARDGAAGLLSRESSTSTGEIGSQVAATGSARGAGAAGAGVLAKLAGVGTAGKVVAACLGGSAAMTACVAAGINPLDLSSGAERPPKVSVESRSRERVESVPAPTSSLPSQLGHDEVEPSVSAAAPESQPAPQGGDGDAATATAPVDPVAPSTPPVEREFGVAEAAAPATPAPSTAGSAPGDGGSGGDSAVQEEFGL